MGILNVTPDSFSDGGQHIGVEQAVQHALQMVQEGAQIIDIGGESTRPGSLKVSLEDELQRTVPVIRALRRQSDVLISIDTSKAEVARQALQAGADIVNDVTGLEGDAAMAEVCAQAGCGMVVMHMQGTPDTMQQDPSYEDVVCDVQGYFQRRLQELVAQGLQAESLCFDPGIGFGKTLEHNLMLLRHLGDLRVGARPLLLGVSRKSMIGMALGDMDMGLRDWPTVALTAHGRMAGAEIHRVHDVQPNAQAMQMVEAVMAQKAEACSVDLR